MIEVYLLGVFISFLWWLLDLFFLQKIDEFSGEDLIATFFLSLFSWVMIFILALRLLWKLISIILDKSDHIIIWKRKNSKTT